MRDLVRQGNRVLTLGELLIEYLQRRTLWLRRDEGGAPPRIDRDTLGLVQRHPNGPRRFVISDPGLIPAAAGADESVHLRSDEAGNPGQALNERHRRVAPPD